MGAGVGQTSLEWGSLTQMHSVSCGALSDWSLQAWVFGAVGSGVQPPTSLALSSGRHSLGEVEEEEGQPPCSHAYRGLHSTPLRQPRRLPIAC